MKYYTEIVPFDLAKKLKEAGYPQKLYTDFAYSDSGELIEWIGRSTLAAPTYAEVIDWFMEIGQPVYMEKTTKGWCGYTPFNTKLNTYCDRATFHEAANAAIEKACELLKEGEK